MPTAPSGRSSTTIGLAIATVLLLVGGLVAFVATRDDGGEQTLTRDSATTTSAPAADPRGDDRTSTSVAQGDGADGGDDDGASTTPTSGGGAPAAVGPAPTVAGRATPSDRATPPKQGTYTYRRTQSGEAPEDTDQIVRDVLRGPGEVRQQIETTDTSTGGRVRHDVIWRGEGLVIASSTFTGPQGSIECDWQPDMLEFPAPLSFGKKWTIESSCDTTAQGQPVRVERKANREVTSAEKLDVGGAAVDTWVVTGDDKVTITVGPPAAPVFRQIVDSTGSINVSPAYGLEVRSVANIKSGDASRTVTQELLSLQPT